MNANRFDRFSRLFAQRRHSRHASAQEATPEPPAGADGHAPELLFVQTFRAGAITPKEGAEGRYTLTLEGGHGQTVYFSDRPDRRVGASPTGEFLDRLGFPDDNPPNAALVVDDGNGSTDVAVVELFSPVYDGATGGVSYEVEVLADWEAELGVVLQEAPSDLAALGPSFGAAHLFIDGLLDCPDGDIVCREGSTGEAVGTLRGSWFNNFCSHVLETGGPQRWQYCVPCGTPPEVLFAGRDSMGNQKFGNAFNVWLYWGNICNERIPECYGSCRPDGWCHKDTIGQVCPNYR